MILNPKAQFSLNHVPNPRLQAVAQVLDHGEIRLVDYMGSDKSIVRSARVSYNDKGKSTDDKLIDYLMKNGHNTPFESCVVTFQVTAPLFVFRQWHRHRTQSYNELSARYTEMEDKFYIPSEENLGKQSKDNKQMRTQEQVSEAKHAASLIRRKSEDAFDVYKQLLDLGVAREQARMVLPVNLYSRMYATANLHNWYRWLKERNHPHAQQEIRVYAEAVQQIILELFPVATRSFIFHSQERSES